MAVKNHLIKKKYYYSPYVPARFTRGALVLIGTRLRLLAVKLLSTVRRTFVSITVSLWNDLSERVFDDVSIESQPIRV